MSTNKGVLNRAGAVSRLSLPLFVLLALTMPPLAARTAASGVSRAEPVAVEQSPEKSLEEQWGIRILGIRRTAANYMLDFRYRVLDAEKARPIFQRKTRPYLIDQASGAKFTVFSSPKTGPMRNTDTPKVDRNYFTFFANPGKFVQAGNKVTVVIGEFKVENLIVK